MSTPRSLAPIIAAMLLFLLTGCGKSSDKLHGTWQRSDARGRRSLVTFGPGNRVKVAYGMQRSEGTYQVDWTQTPAVLDLTWNSGSSGQALVDVTGDVLSVQSNSPGQPADTAMNRGAITFTRQPNAQISMTVWVTILVPVLLLVPVLYVGSYAMLLKRYQTPKTDRLEAYYVGKGLVGFIAWGFFRPLEQTHRTLRPREWKSY